MLEETLSVYSFPAGLNLFPIDQNFGFAFKGKLEYGICCRASGFDLWHISCRTLWAMSDELIRALCTRVITAEGADLTIAMEALKMALHEHSEHVRTLAAAALLNPVPSCDLPQA
jgi:hypothetical protein